MTLERLEAAVPDGEALRYHTPLRTGGTVGVTDDRLLIVDDDVTAVELDAVAEVAVQDIDWFLVVLSVVLVGFGLYSTRNHVLGGLGFAVAGLASLYLTYRKRGEMFVRVTGRSKPLKLYPEDVESLQAALRHVM